MLSIPKILLHLEGLAILILAVLAYTQHANWILFAVLIFAPDIFMLGYLIDKKTGAFFYNVGHTYVIPIVLLIVGQLMTISILVQISLIWFAHIGMDRLLGFGLKYPKAFKDTHLQHV
jgi:hypothetical protein